MADESKVERSDELDAVNKGKRNILPKFPFILAAIGSVVLISLELFGLISIGVEAIAISVAAIWLFSFVVAGIWGAATDPALGQSEFAGQRESLPGGLASKAQPKPRAAPAPLLEEEQQNQAAPEIKDLQGMKFGSGKDDGYVILTFKSPDAAEKALDLVGKHRRDLNKPCFASIKREEPNNKVRVDLGLMLQLLRTSPLSKSLTKEWKALFTGKSDAAREKLHAGDIDLEIITAVKKVMKEYKPPQPSGRFSFGKLYDLNAKMLTEEITKALKSGNTEELVGVIEKVEKGEGSGSTSEHLFTHLEKAGVYALLDRRSAIADLGQQSEAKLG